MGFSFENQGTKTYLVYTIEENDTLDTMSLGMLTNNRIQGLAQTLFTQINGTRYIKYDVSGKVPVKQLFAGPVNKKTLIGVLSGVVNAMLSAENYMLDAYSILLDHEYIFVNASTGETVLVCLPIVSDDLIPRDLGEFFANIMFTAQPDQTENCAYVTKILHHLVHFPVFSADAFKLLLEDIGGPATPVPPGAAPSGQPPASQSFAMPGAMASPARKETVLPPMSVCPSMPATAPVRETQSDGDVKRKSGSAGGLLGLLRRNKKEDVQPPKMDSVQFSAVAPDKVIPGEYLPVNIVMYEDAYRKAVDDILHAHGDNGKEASSGYQDVERNALVKVVLSSPDVTVEDHTEERTWQGKYLNFAFVAKIPEDFAKAQILFVATVYINDVIATRLKLILDRAGKPKKNIYVTRSDVCSAFVSYASQDRSRVAAIIQGMKKARPDMDIFFDIESLRSGQNWETELKNEIENRDVLFLCWSRYARDSKWVDMEWRYALRSKGEDCIEPIPIESPEICPPPIELQQKHFNDKMLYIIKATMPAQVNQPCLVRLKTNERVIIDKPRFLIGKERAYVDFYVGDNAAISRGHAKIISRDGVYYIVDTKSINHTYVDGEMIPSDVETLLKNGAKIRLANEEFEFLC